MHKTTGWEVKSYESQHSNCTSTHKPTIKNVAAFHIASIVNGTTTKQLVDSASTGGHDISKRTAGLAIKMVKTLTTQPWDNSFTYLRSYCELFAHINPGSVIDLTTQTIQGKEHFDSLFFMSGSQARCAMYCKPLLGLDGGHFKTALWNGYIFIVACSKDGNNRDVLLALYICNVENTVNMANIIKGMKCDVRVKEWLNEPNFVFPVDRAACIKAAVSIECPNGLVRDCGKHASRTCGITPLDNKAFWQYVTARTLVKQTEAMDSLKSSNEAAAAKVDAIPKILLCTLQFPAMSWGEITNNISERGIHNVTVECRKLGPVPMLKGVMLINVKSHEKKRAQDRAYQNAYPTEKLCEYAKLDFDVSCNILVFPSYG